MSIRIYSSVCGGFETREPEEGVTFFRDAYDRFKSSRMNAKIFKIMPHLFLDDQITIWLDGNIRFAPGVNITDFVDEFLGYDDIAVFRHSWRDCAYEEMIAVMANNLDHQGTVIDQMNQYRYYGFPEHYGLAECGVIVRRNREIVDRFSEHWWAQICRFSSRDQISFPFVQWYRSYHNLQLPKIRVNDGNVRTDPRFIYTTRQSSYR